MRFLFAITLLFAFVLHSFQHVLTITDYYLDKAAYVKNCVNKYRPKLNCNGRCQLMKKIEKQEKQQEPTLKEIGKQEIVSSLHFFPTVPFIQLGNPAVHQTRYIGALLNRSRSHFHPPAWI
jgi:hypothetical protein